MRFQITIRDLLVATFWFGVTIAAWSWAFRLSGEPSEIFSRSSNGLAVLALAALGWSAMFTAVWSLFGRAKVGLIIGLGMWVLLLAAGFFMLLA